MRLIVFILICQVNFCFGQLEAIYTVKYLAKSNTEPENLQQQKFYENTFQPFVEIMQNSEGILYVCNNQSYFSIQPKANDSDSGNFLAEVEIESSSWITTIEKAGNIDRRLHFLSIADYTIDEWSIENTEKVVGGYKSIKATKYLEFKGFPDLNRVLEVWFTLDVPVDSGFRDATGLPGLITYYNDGRYEFVLKTLKSLTKCDFDVPNLVEKLYSTAAKEAQERINKRRKSRN
jgi:GLPGLI family protein